MKSRPSEAVNDQKRPTKRARIEMNASQFTRACAEKRIVGFTDFDRDRRACPKSMSLTCVHPLLHMMLSGLISLWARYNRWWSA